MQPGSGHGISSLRASWGASHFRLRTVDGCLCIAPLHKFDSMTVEANGNLCIASFMEGGICVISPQGELIEFVRIAQDWFVTNICFGGSDMKKAYITLSGQGQILEMDWARPGHKLNF